MVIIENVSVVSIKIYTIFDAIIGIPDPIQKVPEEENDLQKVFLKGRIEINEETEIRLGNFQVDVISVDEKVSVSVPNLKVVSLVENFLNDKANFKKVKRGVSLETIEHRNLVVEDFVPLNGIYTDIY